MKLPFVSRKWYEYYKQDEATISRLLEIATSLAENCRSYEKMLADLEHTNDCLYARVKQLEAEKEQQYSEK